MSDYIYSFDFIIFPDSHTTNKSQIVSFLVFSFKHHLSAILSFFYSYFQVMSHY